MKGMVMPGLFQGRPHSNSPDHSWVMSPPTSCFSDGPSTGHPLGIPAPAPCLPFPHHLAHWFITTFHQALPKHKISHCLAPSCPHLSPRPAAGKFPFISQIQPEPGSLCLSIPSLDRLLSSVLASIRFSISIFCSFLL